MNGEENVEIIDVALKTKQIIKNGNGKNQLSVFHLFCIAFVAFWFGVIFASITLSTRAIQTTCSPPGCTDSLVIHKDTNILINKSKKHDEGRDKLITRRVYPSDENEHLEKKKIILLHGKVWTKYDKWHRYDWRQCPPKYSNCRVTTDSSRLPQSAAIVYNAADMPSLEHVDDVKNNKKLRRVFLSGLTPLRTTFDPKDYNDFFDLSVTYKSESDIRIPYWPNDGLLPHMYRPKPAKDAREVKGDDMLDLEDEIKDYFRRAGKDPFMGAVITNCQDGHYPNLYMRKLQEEGLIHTYSANDSQSCLKRMKDTVKLPCNDELSDDCVKHFETFKYILTPDEDLCTDYTTRKYWTSIFAWQAVPLLYGAGDYQKHLIPNSYIDCVGKEDYISPSFKKAWYPGENPIKYYKTFHLWRHENRVEKFHWQCELCRALHEDNKPSKLDMSSFWNKETNCGEKLRIHELMRLQLVRTGVIR